MLEVEMVEKCYEYLVEANTYESVVREVPFLSRCIDLVLFSQNHEAITIEFKMKNWRQAIEQAANHMLGADKAYICLPIKKPSRELISILEDKKIGLFLYCPEEKELMYEYLPAPINTRKVDKFYIMLAETAYDISKSASSFQ